MFSQLAGCLVDPGVAGQHGAGARGVHDEAGGISAGEDPQPPPGRAVPVARREDPPGRLVGVQVPRAPRPLRDHVIRTMWPTLLNPSTYRGMARLALISAKVLTGRRLERQPLSSLDR